MRQRPVRITWYDCIMRTTLSIDDDVLDAARGLAEATHVPLGRAVSTLARRGLVRIRLRTSDDGLPVLDVPADFPRIEDADVARILSDFP